VDVRGTRSNQPRTRSPTCECLFAFENPKGVAEARKRSVDCYPDGGAFRGSGQSRPSFVGTRQQFHSDDPSNLRQIRVDIRDSSSLRLGTRPSALLWRKSTSQTDVPPRAAFGHRNMPGHTRPCVWSQTKRFGRRNLPLLRTLWLDTCPGYDDDGLITKQINAKEAHP
jgi:hypothetical protein